MQPLWHFARRRAGAVPAALAVLSLVVVVVTSVSCRDGAAARDAQARMRFSQVISDFNQSVGDRSNKAAFRRVVADAQKIRDEYPTSQSAQLAQYYIAVSEEFLGNSDQCEQNLRELIRNGDRVMKPIAQFALGALYRNHGESDRAMQVYGELEASGALSVHEHHPGHQPESTHSEHQSGSTTEVGAPTH